jgi:hypothetical protein
MGNHGGNYPKEVKQQALFNPSAPWENAGLQIPADPFPGGFPAR